MSTTESTDVAVRDGLPLGTAADTRPDAASDPAFAPTDPQVGLSDAEAESRRAAGKGNDYRPPTSRTYWEIFRDNSYPMINGPLLLVSGLLITFGSMIDALITAGPVLSNIMIGVIQGSRAKQKLDRVALLTRPRSVVVRGGVEREIDPAHVVLGDIVAARRGDEIQLDGRVVTDGGASVDESALTGESDPIDKAIGDGVLSGSAVVGGAARYEVQAVGASTFANRVLAQAKGKRDVRTPLQGDVARAIAAVAVLILASTVGVAMIASSLPGDSPQGAVVAAAVLVTLVPQGLALMLTVTYAAAAVRISRLGALAQRQSAIEAMSRIDTFCTDKTGTLTTQRIRFAAAEPIGDLAGLPPLPELLAAVASSTGSPNNTTSALAAAFPGAALPVDEEVAFSSSLRWSAVRFASSVGTGARDARTFVLGAPAVLLAAMDAPDEAVAQRVRELASLGQRVLLLAGGSDSASLGGRDDPSLPLPLEPLAVLTFVEELRPEAQATLDGFRERGIEVKVVSGDDPTTVEAIARRLGLQTRGETVSGLDIAHLDDEALAEVADRTTVFGRVDPHLKARIVTALRSRGRYVAMTGDGVNDILPVRSANVGIAMQSGSPATRGVADLVLIKDDFSILPEAIRDGQRIVAAMAATLIVLLARTFYVLLIILGAELARLPFPFTPRQNSILAFVTVGIPILVLALWVEPRPAKANLLGQTLRVSIPVSIGVTLVALPVYALSLVQGASEDVARTILTTVSSLMGIGLLTLIPVAADTEGRLRMPAWARTTLLIAAMVGSFLVVIGTPFGRSFFDLEPLSFETLGVLGAIAVAWTIAVQLIRRTGVVQDGIDLLIAGWRRATSFRRRPDAATR
jgi:cation-transporting ATPase E